MFYVKTNSSSNEIKRKSDRRSDRQTDRLTDKTIKLLECSRSRCGRSILPVSGNYSSILTPQTFDQCRSPGHLIILIMLMGFVTVLLECKVKGDRTGNEGVCQRWNKLKQASS